MDHDGIPGPLLFDLKMESPFSFKCQVCGACCYNKAIPVGPYEALRIARHLGITTTEFFRTSTQNGGAVLRNRPDGSCLFLGIGGCSIHPDRPLVCRLFPLGQINDTEGWTKYGVMPLHPDCLGHFDSDGTVDSYVASQELGPYFHYDLAYEVIFRKIQKKLEETELTAGEIPSPADAQPLEARSPARPKFLSIWQDIDKTAAAFQRKNRRKEPGTLGEVVSLHLEAIDDWLAKLKKHRRRERRRKGTSPL